MEETSVIKIDELALSLAAAQNELENAAKNAVNPHLKNKYADLSSVINAIRPVFSKHGIAIVQLLSTHVDNCICYADVETKLIHRSGQSITSTLSLPATKTDPQSLGSVFSYGRRYSLSAIAGITQEDDDANGAGRKPPVIEKEEPTLDHAVINKINAAETEDDLKAIWKGLPVGVRSGYTHIINARKADLNGGAA